MAGLIKREDIAAVREAASIRDIVGEHVSLRPAGMNSEKGLCPFHDEKTPSFHVRTELNVWHCFGCGEGGDVISFVQKLHHLSFTEAVEYLADKTGITLHYEEGQGPRRTEEPGRRQRLIEAHRLAEQFFQEQLATPQARAGREFLASRGFDRDAAARFGIGYSPDSWDALSRHLRGRGFTEAELVASGLVSQGSRGTYDRFRGRLMWPIRDITGATVGFGARILTDAKDQPKYLNTPETAIYKKSKVLYGLDLAKGDISKLKQVVVVEGYTDVMAAHLAGVPTAVATCGTAFGSEHAKILRRLIGESMDSASGVVLSDGQVRGGEVIFTFDGDAAGQKAALRAFAEDQNFAAQTYVAIEKSGLDPCDLRLQQGNQAVVNLVNQREPLFAFVIRTALSGLDLNTVEGRATGMRAAAQIVAGIRDAALRSGYARELAGWVSLPEDEVLKAVRSYRSRSRQGSSPQQFAGGSPQTPSARPSPRRGKTLQDPVIRAEGEAMAAILQRPAAAVEADFDSYASDVFTVPTLRAVHDLIRSVGGVRRFQELLIESDESHAVKRWNEEIREASGGTLDGALTSLMVKSLPSDSVEGEKRFAVSVIKSIYRMWLTRQIADLRGALQRASGDDEEGRKLFTHLMELEQVRRQLGN
ncbi:DNA primase [Boudabousia marimammalium]|uniref:DNA primase n=1 Tax=Boudabousia marimammalium TaxID=156892 RepID=A0A1Q5PP70_9ACTO|nr:DNA primase [Boudabousia marimammalium]OKL49309.1 DNA primase [Boudabousia marimammalium]